MPKLAIQKWNAGDSLGSKVHQAIFSIQKQLIVPHTCTGHKKNEERFSLIELSCTSYTLTTGSYLPRKLFHYKKIMLYLGGYGTGLLECQRAWNFIALLCFRCYLHKIGPLVDSDREIIFQLSNFMPLFNSSALSSITCIIYTNCFLFSIDNFLIVWRDYSFTPWKLLFLTSYLFSAKQMSIIVNTKRINISWKPCVWFLMTGDSKYIPYLLNCHYYSNFKSKSATEGRGNKRGRAPAWKTLSRWQESFRSSFSPLRLTLVRVSLRGRAWHSAEVPRK